MVLLKHIISIIYQLYVSICFLKKLYDYYIRYMLYNNIYEIKCMLWWCRVEKCRIYLCEFRVCIFQNHWESILANLEKSLKWWSWRIQLLADQGTFLIIFYHMPNYLYFMRLKKFANIYKKIFIKISYKIYIYKKKNIYIIIIYRNSKCQSDSRTQNA